MDDETFAYLRMRDLIAEHPQHLNAQDKLGQTPAHSAMLQCNVGALRALGEAGADFTTLRDLNGKTVHDYAVDAAAMAARLRAAAQQDDVSLYAGCVVELASQMEQAHRVVAVE